LSTGRAPVYISKTRSKLNLFATAYVGFLFALDTKLNPTFAAKRVFYFKSTITIYRWAVNYLPFTLSNSKLFLILKVLYPRLIIDDVFDLFLCRILWAFIFGALRLLIVFNISLKAIIKALRAELVIALAQLLG
jgi:hypothetical protein